jgi:hypothetical protein
MKPFKIFYEQANDQYVVLLPGGYKPPTKGHMHMIKEYNDNPRVANVIVMIGPKDREGFTREQSLKVFNLYGIDQYNKVVIESTVHNAPITAGFDFVEKDPRAMKYRGLVFGFGASNKGDDQSRMSKLVDYFKKYPDRLRDGLRVGVPPVVNALESAGDAVSATTLRRAIMDNDLKTISSLIPSGVDPREFIEIFKS